MANGLNKVMLIGNLGRDPEMRYLPSGKPATHLSLAVSRRLAAVEGAANEETEWFHVVLYDKLAELANQWLAKGRRVYVEGRLQTRRWDGRDGQPQARTEIVASDLLFLDGGRPAAAGVEPGTASVPDDEQPF